LAARSALEHSEKCRASARGKFRPLDRRVEVGRADRHGPWRAAERLERTDDQVDQRTFLWLADDLEQVDRRILVKPQYGIVDQRDRAPASWADAHGVALAKGCPERSPLPVGRLMLHFHLALDRHQFADNGHAWFGGMGACHPGQSERAQQQELRRHGRICQGLLHRSPHRLEVKRRTAKPGCIVFARNRTSLRRSREVDEAIAKTSRQHIAEASTSLNKPMYSWI
jgi:hypothetical protein